MLSSSSLGRGLIVAGISLAASARLVAIDNVKCNPVAEAATALAKMHVKAGDCPQFGVSPLRNNVSAEQNIPE